MKIQPIEIPLVGIATDLEIKILPFTTDDVTCTLYYEIKTEDGSIIKKANYTLTVEEFTSWGADNAYINNLVLNLPENEGLEALSN